MVVQLIKLSVVVCKIDDQVSRVYVVPITDGRLITRKKFLYALMGFGSNLV